MVNALRQAALIACAVALAVAETPAQSPAGQSQQPVFRGRTAIAPIEVAVLDHEHRPVTDLRPSDFIVREDGIEREVRIFVPTAISAQPVDAGAPAPLRANGGDELTPHTRRVFLISIGADVKTDPTKPFDATLQFIREQLLPQDLVGVILFNRVSDLTTDHASIAAMLQRYLDRQAAIREKIRIWLSTRPSGDLPPDIQADVDALFANSTGATPRPHSVLDLILDTDYFKGADSGPARKPWQLWTLARNDVKAYAGVEYLRFVDGEKRLVMLTYGGLGLPAVDDDKGIAAFASSSGVVIDMLHAGGTPAFIRFASAAPEPRPNGPTGTGSGGLQAVPYHAPGTPPKGQMSPALRITNEGFYNGNASSERIASLTGGQFLGTSFASTTFARIDETTKFGYLLGYVPLDDAGAKPRRITVEVKRPDVDVFFRHGGTPPPPLSPAEIHESLATSRIAGAGSFDRDSTDITVTAAATASVSNGTPAIDVRATIDTSRVSIVPHDGRFGIDLDIEIFCGDTEEHVVGSTKGRLSLSLTPEEYEQVRRAGLTYSARVRVSGAAKYAKVVVYDFEKDLLGTSTVTVH